MINYSCFVFVLILCFKQSIQNISAEQYHFETRIRTTDTGNMNLYTFETVLRIGIKQCVELCKTKKRCKYINFRVRMNCCFLIAFVNGENSTLENVFDKEAGFVFANMSDWNMGDDSSCIHCNDDGCHFPDEKKNAQLLGNMFSVGSKGVYSCVDGYAKNTTDISRTTCNNNGTWSTTHIKCLPDIVFTEDVLVFDGTYYKLVREAMHWTQAKQYCEEHGGYLADILSPQEQEIAAKLAALLVKSVWIGGGRKDYLQFTWLDETPVNSGYTNWNTGQPYHPYSPDACIYMSVFWNYRWDDTFCSSRRRSICKIK